MRWNMKRPMSFADVPRLGNRPPPAACIKHDLGGNVQHGERVQGRHPPSGEALAREIPAFRLYLGAHVEIIAARTGADLAVGAQAERRRDPRRAHQAAAAGAGPLSQEDIDRAIAEGATGR